MESLHGPINPSIFGEEHLDVESLEQEESNNNALGYCISYGPFGNTGNWSFEEEEEGRPPPQQLRTPSLDDKMPFLHMLQSGAAESPPFSASLTEPASFQVLLRLQHQKKPWDQTHNYVLPAEIYMVDTSTSSPVVVKALQEPESCLTHVISSETKEEEDPPDQHPHPHSVISSAVDGVSSNKCYHQQEQPNNVELEYYCSSRYGKSGGSSSHIALGGPAKTRARVAASPPPVNNRARRKQRTRPPKDKEEVESQRMSHIAVERNRRRQMNDHLTALRTLMPPSYIQRGDQASIIGGAIDFVKGLEQLLQSLQAQKRMRKADEESSSSSSSRPVVPTFNGDMISSSSPAQQKNGGVQQLELESSNCSREEKGLSADLNVQVSVIQKHVNLKIQCGRSPGQLLRVIVALEDLRLTVLHLNITSSLELEASLHYSFSLKIEDDCRLRSADEIAGAIHQVFSFING